MSLEIVHNCDAELKVVYLSLIEEAQLNVPVRAVDFPHALLISMKYPTSNYFDFQKAVLIKGLFTYVL